MARSAAALHPPQLAAEPAVCGAWCTATMLLKFLPFRAADAPQRLVGEARKIGDKVDEEAPMLRAAAAPAAPECGLSGAGSALPRAAPLVVAALGGLRLRVRDGVLGPETLAELLAGVRASPYFGENAGENSFYRGTLGFHVKFRDTHRHMVEEHLPFLAPALQAVLRPECNCFFVNVFFARPDGQGYHTDNFFTDYCGSFRPTDIVTVAYLSASEEMRGGELVVLDAAQDEVRAPPRRGEEAASAPVLGRVRPVPGRVVDFDGRLLHAVLPFESPEPRVSLVAEQCRLVRRHFLKTPRFSIYSQRTNQEIVLA